MGEGAGVLVWGQLLERAVGAHRVVVVLPAGDDLAGIIEVGEPVLAEALRAEFVVKALDVRVFDGLPWADEGELHLSGIRPRIERARRTRGRCRP